MSARVASSRPAFSPRPLHALFFTAFILAYVVPMAWTGLTKAPMSKRMPMWWQYITNASCLFTIGVEQWADYYTLAWPEGSPVWVELDSAVYSPSIPFGTRARIHWFTAYRGGAGRHDPNPERPREQVRQLAEWYRKRYGELNPGAPPLKALRLVTANYPVGQGTPGAPGRWRPLKALDVERSRLVVITEFVYDEAK